MQYRRERRLGRITIGSDIDVTVIVEGLGISPALYYHSEYGLKFEFCVFDYESWKLCAMHAAEEAESGVLLQALNGLVVRDKQALHGSMTDLAAALFAEGPKPLSKEQLQAHKRSLANLRDDLAGANQTEMVFIVHRLFQRLVYLAIRLNGGWCGDGKWAARRLSQYAPDMVEPLLNAVQKTDDTTAILECADKIIGMLGGPATDGYLTLPLQTGGLLPETYDVLTNPRLQRGISSRVPHIAVHRATL